MDNMESSIIDLQTRLSFQDGLVEQLNSVVTDQQQQIMKLETQISLLKSQMKSLQTAQSSFGEIKEPPPPHY